MTSMSDSREEGTQRPQMHPVSGISVVCWQKIISVITNWKQNVYMKGGILSVSACLRVYMYWKQNALKIHEKWHLSVSPYLLFSMVRTENEMLHERKHVSFSLCSPESRYLKSTRRGQWLKYFDNWITNVIELIASN